MTKQKILKNYTFEHDFLMEKFTEENPEVLDDMISDSFNDWMERLDVQEVIDYAQEYAITIENKILKEIKEDIKEIKYNLKFK